MRSVHAQIGRILDLDLPVLIEGETGTGKEVAAWLLHHRGPRRGRPFVTLNCAAMNEGLMESELFGHPRRTVSGRGPRQAGLLAAARSGTLFLDEVGELSSGAQCKLLRLVEGGEASSGNSRRARCTDVRIVAATGTSLEAAVEAGRFRRDLYYRLRVLTLRMPPLRDRREDIPILAERLLEDVCRRLAVPAHQLSREALTALAIPEWPGNVRQLLHELERAVVASDGLEIGVSHLSPEIQGLTGGLVPPATSSSPERGRHPGSSLAASDLAVDELLRRLAGLPGSHESPTRRTPISIPGYQLIERIAEGGMGEVWRAEQREPVRREVAIKLIRAGMNAQGVIGRFEAERQALALMDHPAIPKVLAAGATDAGRPYLVMEYVRGVSLDQHCDQERLPVRARLELFRQLCAGVQHAHRKAILHRDLKPANVLVAFTDGKPQAKIVDFGIAKALAQPLTEKALQTEVGRIVGTLEYMSPEQADLTPEDIDPRSDVYSLGVILYQLLSGFLPFSGAELRRAGPEELRRHLRDVDPPLPSARLLATTEEVKVIARKRGSEPRPLRRELEGDLDAIVMKALERNRVRRYESVAELSADVGRYLDHQPVIARRSHADSRFSRYLSRRRAAVAAGAGLLLLLLQVGFSADLGLKLRQASHVAGVGSGSSLPLASCSDFQRPGSAVPPPARR